MVTISVIMPSYLGFYKGAAKERHIKLQRAVQSFLDQDYEYKELVIVADGCQDTIDFIHTNYEHEPNIRCFLITKQEEFSGQVRQAGIEKAMGSLITYLDIDDVYGRPDHLTQIVNGFLSSHPRWIYFNDFIKYFVQEHLPMHERDCKISRGEVGTSQIAHQNTPQANWQGCDGYGHDFMFVQKLNGLYPNPVKITGPSYWVCHIPNVVDT